MDINLTNIPPQGQGTFPIPLRWPSLRQNLERYLAEIIPSFVVGSVFRWRGAQKIIYHCRLNIESAPDLEQCLAILPKSGDLKSLLTPQTSSPDLYFEVRWEQPNRLNLSLSDEQLIRWLAYLWRSPQFMDQSPSRGVETVWDDFPLQYAHARCWTALRQAQEAGDRQEWGSEDEKLKIKAGPSLSLVNLDRGMFLLGLPLDPPTRSLLQQLVAFVDHRDDPKQATLILVGRQLGHALLEYVRYGALREKMASPALAQARLGLGILGQQSLQWLLENRCGVMARKEL